MEYPSIREGEIQQRDGKAGGSLWEAGPWAWAHSNVNWRAVPRGTGWQECRLAKEALTELGGFGRDLLCGLHM